MSPGIDDRCSGTLLPPVICQPVTGDPRAVQCSGRQTRAIRDIAIKNAQENREGDTMGNPYLSSNESIILSTNNIVVNSVPAEAILTNERLMLIDTRHAQLRPQDIPFYAIETVTIGEDPSSDPVISLSLITGPGVTLPLEIVFPQQLRTRRLAERDEWANRLRELSTVTVREGGAKSMEILPPWVPGPLPEEPGEGVVPEQESEAESKFRNPPLMPRKQREPAVQKNRTVIMAAVIVIVLVALAAGAYVLAPSLFGNSGSPLSPPAPEPTTVMTPVTTDATPVVTATVAIPATSVPATPEIIIPQNGVWLLVTYEGSYSGSAGAPERFRDIAATGDRAFQLPVRDEVVSATIQKQDNTGRKLTVEIYNEGALVKSGSVNAPRGTVSINADLRTT